jgi:protein TonB
MVEPQYPVAAKRAGIQGSVLIRAAVSKQGRVRNIQVLQGDPALIEAAVAAVKLWRYTPSYQAGQAIETERDIIVQFTLDNPLSRRVSR